MQVVRPGLTRQCPFILESDVLSLSSDFTARKNATILLDRRLGARHAIDTPGNHVLRALEQGVPCRTLRNIAAQHDIQELQLCELLGFMNSMGALRFAPRSAGQISKAWLQRATHLLVGVRYAQRVWRQPAAPLALVIGASRACLPIAITIGATGTFFVSAGLSSAYQATYVGLFGWIGFIASLWAHESMHVAALPQQSPVVVLQGGMRLGIIHQTLPPKTEIVSAVLGPCGGILCGGILAFVAVVLGHTTLGALSVCIGAFHFVSFLPWYGDGHSIRLALQKQHRTTA